MKPDALKQFINLRQSLMAERVALEKRLAEIDAALGGQPTAVTAKTVRPRWQQASNELSLKEAILKVLAHQSLTKDQILEGVQKLGYRFSTAKPMNSINVILYGKKPKFKNANGKFSPVN